MCVLFQTTLNKIISKNKSGFVIGIIFEGLLWLTMKIITIDEKPKPIKVTQM